MKNRSRNSIKCAILLTLLLGIISLGHATEKLRIIGEDSFPPYNYYVTKGLKVKKEIRGFTVELINLMLKDIAIEKQADIELFTWARVLKIIENEPNVLILDIVRNPAREEHYKVGVMRGSSSSDKLMAYGFEEGNNLAFVSKEIQNINKIMKQRVDFVTFSPVELAWRLKLLTPQVDINIFEPTYLLSGELEYYFALSKKTSNETVLQLQTALDQIKKDGRFLTLWKKYMQ